MELIQEIRAKIKRRQYEFSKHAVDQSIIRDLSVEDMEDAVAGQSEIIEDLLCSDRIDKIKKKGKG